MTGNAPLFQTDVRVSFGDCDPAGIVFYPNFFRWADQLFHLYLDEKAAGHDAVCKAIDAIGLGLKSAEMQFRSPVASGQKLRLSLDRLEWDERALRLYNSGWVGDREAFQGKETRAVFVRKDGQLRAGETAPLRALLA